MCFWGAAMESWWKALCQSCGQDWDSTVNEKV